MRTFVKITGLFGALSFLPLLGCSDNGSSSLPDSGGQAGQTSQIGEAGAASVDGVNGTDGVNGKDGVKGKDGVNGKDGVDGTNGKDGANGPDGMNGTNGTDGNDGTNGTNGADGTNGSDGMNGSDGTNGTNGTDGANGADGKDGMTGANGSLGAAGKNSLIVSNHELAGDHCPFAGVRFDSGLDLNSDGVLSSDEYNLAETQYVCNSEVAWGELAALPTVNTAYSFALATNDQDGTPRLGFMFKDDAYRQALLSAGGVLWDGGGVYSGSQVFGVYKLGGELGKTWLPYEGRLTPQTYQFSELEFNAGQSYYTTTYPSFGGLISVVKSGQTGTYALTPAFVNRKSHSVGFFGGKLFGLLAQKTVGLTLSTFPIDQFGVLNNLWTNLVTLEADATTISDPSLLPAGDRFVAAYVRAGKAYVRASQTPASAAQPADFPIVGQVEDAVHESVAWDGSKLYLATLSSSGALTVQRLAFTDGAVWETVATSVTGAVTDVALAGRASGVLLGLRQGGALRVYLTPSDTWPSFDALLAGNFSLINGATGATLAVLNLDAAATHTLRTFQH